MRFTPSPILIQLTFLTTNNVLLHCHQSLQESICQLSFLKLIWPAVVYCRCFFTDFWCSNCVFLATPPTKMWKMTHSPVAQALSSSKHFHGCKENLIRSFYHNAVYGFCEWQTFPNFQINMHNFKLTFQKRLNFWQKLRYVYETPSIELTEHILAAADWRWKSKTWL